MTQTPGDVILKHTHTHTHTHVCVKIYKKKRDVIFILNKVQSEKGDILSKNQTSVMLFLKTE